MPDSTSALSGLLFWVHKPVLLGFAIALPNLHYLLPGGLAAEPSKDFYPAVTDKNLNITCQNRSNVIFILVMGFRQAANVKPTQLQYTETAQSTTS